MPVAGVLFLLYQSVVERALRGVYVLMCGAFHSLEGVLGGVITGRHGYRITEGLSIIAGGFVYAFYTIEVLQTGGVEPV